MVRLNLSALGWRWHVFTSFNDHVVSVYRDEKVPRDVHALMQPYRGMVVQVIDAADGDRTATAEWLAADYLPALVRGPVALATVFAPRPLPEGKLSHVREPDGVSGMLTVLSFLDVDPLECWDESFAGAIGTIDASGRGTLAVQAAFIPTHHGTDDYTDQLF